MATAPATAELNILGVGDISEATGAPPWAVRKVLDALNIAKRFGPNRIIAAADLDLVRDELGRRGYIDEQGGAWGGRLPMLNPSSGRQPETAIQSGVNENPPPALGSRRGV